MDGKPSIHAGHRARLRERFRQEGLSAFSEHEVLELLLTYAIPQRDVNPLAHALIARFGSLAGVLEAEESELVQVNGVGQTAASLLCLMPQLMGRYQRSAMGERPIILDLASAKRYVAALYVGVHEECVYMICLDQSGRVLSPALLHRGTIDQVTLYPREVVEAALRHHAHAVLLAHNHPSGGAEPSQADYDTTHTVINALRVIGVRVVDHLILSAGGVSSMMERSQLDGAQQEMSYMIRSRSVPGKPGTLREEQEIELAELRL